MDKNENILIGLIVSFIVIPVILVGAYYVLLFYLVSKTDINVEVFSDSIIQELKDVEGIINSDTFKPTHLSFENPSGTDYYSYYDFQYEISKDEYEENRLSYGSEDNFDTLSYGLHKDEKDENTYLCHAKITKTFSPDKFEKLEKIYNEIHGVSYSTPTSQVSLNTIPETSNTAKENVNAPEISKEFWEEYDLAINNLDANYFVTDFSTYKSGTEMKKLSTDELTKIAEVGFKESAKRIAGEGADNVESQRIKLEEIVPNNYFTRKYNESDDAYPNLKMTAYIVTRENEMGCGISIYIDPTTGLIVGGEAFGD